VTPLPSLVDFFCPACRSSLMAAEGALRCANCQAAYPVKDGIARFVPADNYSQSFGLQWNRHRRTQLDSAVGRPISEQRLYQASGWPRDLRGQRILEAGSGAGRFTEVLCRTGADIYSFDYSSAVDANRQNNGAQPNLRLFQADIFRNPLPEAWFDHVLCLGVLQHTPDPERAFRSLARHVKPGGDLVIDVYRRSLAAALQWKYVLRPLTKRLEPSRLRRSWRRRAGCAVWPAAPGRESRRSSSTRISGSRPSRTRSGRCSILSTCTRPPTTCRRARIRCAAGLRPLASRGSRCSTA
jgi:SAM-dependent methyltransferase